MPYSIKIVTKLALTAEDEAVLKDEIRVLKLLDHEHINKLHHVYDENLYNYIVLEKINGGELFDRIVAKDHYNEK